MKDHEIAKLHNDLRDTAKKYANAEQLRSRLVWVLEPLVAELDKANSLLAEIIHSELDLMGAKQQLQSENAKLKEALGKDYEGFAKITQSLDYAERGRIAFAYAKLNNEALTPPSDKPKCGTCGGSGVITVAGGDCPQHGKAFCTCRGLHAHKEPCPDCKERR